MTPSQACIDLVKRFEGCRLSSYPDPGTGGEPVTIGWGHTDPGKLKLGVKWTQERCDQALAADLGKVAVGVAQALSGAPTTQHEFDGLCSFAFNVGLGNLRNSTLLKMHRAGDHSGAAAQFTRWNKGGGRVMAGLTLRRIAEARLYKGLPV